MPVVIKYKEWVVTNPEESIWVYDFCEQLPKWDEKAQDYIFSKSPKRVDPRLAREKIKEYKLKCVFSSEDGKIYA